jgi:hypothetical protein
MPSFGDAYKSDTEILSEVADWLSITYANRILLTGIIYLHRIIDPTLEGSAMRNLRVFKQLCGSEAFTSVALVTTFWSHVDEIIGSEREKSLMQSEDFWGLPMGSTVYRQDNGKISAKEIVDCLIMRRRPVVLDIQREIVDCGRTLGETAAGLELEILLAEERKKAEKQFKEIQGEL